MVRDKKKPSDTFAAQDAFDKIDELVERLRGMNKHSAALLVERLNCITHAANFGGDDEGFSLAATDILAGIRLYLCSLYDLEFLDGDDIETKYAPDEKES